MTSKLDRHREETIREADCDVLCRLMLVKQVKRQTRHIKKWNYHIAVALLLILVCYKEHLMPTVNNDLL